MEYHAYCLSRRRNKGKNYDKGALVGVDLLKFKRGPYVLEYVGSGLGSCSIFQGSFLSPSVLTSLSVTSPEPGYDLMTSDVSPNRTGDKRLDSVRQNELAMGALEVAGRLGKRGGSVVVKFSRGEGWGEVDRKGKGMFEDWRIVKPDASRMESRESFFLGRKMRGEEDDS